VTARTVVIGVGNPSRRDDGVGWVVASAAGRRLGDAVDIDWSDGEPTRVLDAWADRDLAVVVDAMCSGLEPGAIRLLDGNDVEGVQQRGLGSHAVGLGEAAALGRALGRLPRRLVFVGIEGHDHRLGDGLSPEVTASIDRAVELIAGLVTEPSRADGGACADRPGQPSEATHRARSAPMTSGR
jgi:hydrogenase maturation protease